jgi:hypothetical protein
MYFILLHFNSFYFIFIQLNQYDYAPKPLDSRMSTAFGLLEPEQSTAVTTTTTTLGGQQVTIKGSVTHSQHKLAVVCSSACDKGNHFIYIVDGRF